MIDVTKHDLSTIKAILFAHMPPAEVRAFGSRYKWTAKNYSDLDLAIVGEHPLTLSELSELREAFESSDLPFRVDLVDWNTISPEFQWVIEQGYEVIQKRRLDAGSNGWKTDKLMNLCSKIGSGATPRGGKESYLDKGPIALVRSQNILDFFFSYDGLAFIDQEQANQLSNVELQEKDVLLNITGDSVARVCQVPDAILPARVNQHVSIIRPDSSKLNPEYLKYFLLNPKFKNHMLALASVGATRPALTKGIIEDFEIDLPPLLQQQRIASILSAIDEKIEQNRQTNELLESIAQLAFEQWFGGITDGNKYKLGELVESVSATHKLETDRIIFLNTSDIQDGKVLNNQYSLVEGLPGQAKKSIKKLDMLFTEIRPANKRFALVDFDAENYVVSTKLMVLRSKAFVHPIIIYNFLTSSYILNHLQHLAETRSGTFPQITFDQVKELEISLPPNELLETYTTLAWSLFQKMRNNDLQSTTLSQIRDLLLPKLISGEIEL